MYSGDNGKMCFFQNNLYLALGPTYEPLEQQNIGYLPLEGLVPDRCSEVINSVPSHGIGQVRVFPSPAADIVQVRTLPEMVGALLSVVDQLGREVIPATRVDSTHETLQVDDLATGAYTVVVTGNTGRYTARFQKE